MTIVFRQLTSRRARFDIRDTPQQVLPLALTIHMEPYTASRPTLNGGQVRLTPLGGNILTYAPTMGF